MMQRAMAARDSEHVLFDRAERVTVAAVIPVWNGAEDLVTCLDSLQLPGNEVDEVWVIDNGSVDGTAAVAAAHPLRPRVIHNDENLGFSVAVNQGIRSARTEAVLTLNADVCLTEGCVTAMSQVLARGQSRRVGSVGAKLFRADGLRLDSTGIKLSASRRFFDRGAGEADVGMYDTDTNIFGPCAAVALYDRKMLESIRYGDECFDEDFFFLVEDVDLAWRAQLKGWRSEYAPTAVAHHVRAVSDHSPAYRQYLSVRNRYLMMLKNDEWHARHLWMAAMYDIPRALWMSVTNPSALRGLSDAWRLRHRMRQKRHVQTNQSVTCPD